GGASRLRNAARVELGGVARLGDLRRRGRGHDTGERARVDERELGLEQRLQPGPVGQRLGQLVRDEDRGERRHVAKKTVSRSPCIWISNRSPPPSRSATSVPRRSGGSASSTASVSPGK